MATANNTPIDPGQVRVSNRLLRSATSSRIVLSSTIRGSPASPMRLWLSLCLPGRRSSVVATDVDNPPPAIGSDEVRQAVERLRPWAHRTPVLQSRTLNARSGGTVLLKCENFQRVGAFKFRGAMNALLQLNDVERAAGVVTHSSGNHAQAV